MAAKRASALPQIRGQQKNKSERSPANTSSQGRALLVQFVAVPAAPMPYARATGIKRQKGAIRMSNGCAPLVAARRT